MSTTNIAARPRNTPRIPEPERRLLRTFAFDPMTTRLSGKFLVVSVAYESQLQPGPAGDLLTVVDYDPAREVWYQPVDLNDPAVLAQDGLLPDDSDPRVHQQIVYAVTMSVIERFERFLGRRFRWRSDQQLRLVPHAFEGRNAFFDPGRRAVLFGYYQADQRDPGPNLPGQLIFTCLSNDIIAHETTHALVHRLRRYFLEATNPDVFAFHEALADLVALFQHFLHHDVVTDAVTTSSGELGHNGGLLDLAQEFGKSSGRGQALRSAIGTERTPARFRDAVEPHDRGACFVSAVFDAYLDSYQASIADLRRIASGGTGLLPPGNLHPDLVHRVAHEAVKNADRLLGMIVRATDYLPTVDVNFGDVVRAIVTADRALYPNDTDHLRRNLVEAMRARGIYPDRVTSLADSGLAWPAPQRELNLNDGDDQYGSRIDLKNLITSATMDLDTSGEAGAVGHDWAPEASADDLNAQLMRQVTGWARRHAVDLGLDPDPVHKIALVGLHVSYRRAADQQPRPELVLQLMQRRSDLEDQSLTKNHRPPVRAGTTLIAGVDGRIKYIVAKPLPTTAQVRANPAGLDSDGDPGWGRLNALRRWMQQANDADPLSAWTMEPAVNRLSFALIHNYS